MPRSSLASELTLPPPFTPIKLREVGDAFGHARTVAAESGAGTLVYVGRFDLAEFAVVVEPEEPLRSARRALYAGMAALADALAASCEPETAIEIVWPDTITVNLGLVGGGQLAWPPRTAEDEVPAWLVFGAMIRIVSLARDEPGLRPLSTALEEEGFGTTASDQVIERFARHFMAAVDSWQESGFGTVARKFLPYLGRESGVRREIDENGDLLVARIGTANAERLPLTAALAEPSWFDPKTKGPRA